MIVPVVAIAWLLFLLVQLYARDVHTASRFMGISAVLGGLIGASGAAGGVYLALILRRRDEARQVDESLRAEVMEFSYLSIGLLDLLTRPVPQAGAACSLRK